MDGGMICNCDDNTLEQLGIRTEENRLNFVNFYCKGCGKFVHLHALMPIDADEQPKYCAPCSFQNAGKGE